MRAFAYANPSTKEEAVQLLSQHGGEAALLAGGTDLLSLMKDDVVTPRVVVNLKSIGELGGIRHGNGALEIGALVTLDELLANSDVKQHFPALIQAAQGVSSPQIRSQGTVGGDLCQRPRCWYFRDGYGLLPVHNGQSMVTQGDNRYHAILGATDSAYFVNPSSLAPALIALGARLKILGPRGDKEMALEDFFRVPTSSQEKEYNLAPDEFVTQVRIPSAESSNATYEVREREVLDWPLAAAAVSLQMAGSTIQSARLVLGHVAPIPWAATSAAQMLQGKTLNVQTAEEAGRAAVEGARPLSRNRYKIQLARVAAKRALLRAAGMEV